MMSDFGSDSVKSRVRADFPLYVNILVYTNYTCTS